MAYYIPKLFSDIICDFSQQEDSKLAVKNYLQASREKLDQFMDARWPIARQIKFLTYSFDRCMIFLYERALEKFPDIKNKTCLFAQGGYGRAEMNYYSDIDLLLIFDDMQPELVEHFVQELFYPIWDAGEQLGYSTRSLKDCWKIVASDQRALSAMLDARLLSGDPSLAEQFRRGMEKNFYKPNSVKSLLLAKSEEKKERKKRFGDSVFLGEPHVKESAGALRDWHIIHYGLLAESQSAQVSDWVRYEYISNEEADEIVRAQEYLWLTRNFLHRYSGKGNDRLSFEMQEKIAKDLNFEDSKESLAVEKFMKQYYGHAANLNRVSNEVLRRLSGSRKRGWLFRLKSKFMPKLDKNFSVVNNKITTLDFESLKEDPVNIVKAFYYFQKYKTPLSDALVYWIRSHLHLLDEKFRALPQVNQYMRNIFLNLDYLGRTLEAMHESGFLSKIMPAFSHIEFQAQHDAYHYYTVDTHLVLAVEELSKLHYGYYNEKFPQYKLALTEIKARDLLALGVLFHDVGKGRGGDHSNKGADIGQEIMRTMGYSEQQIQRVDFLVRSHLIMSQISQRRDLEDPALIETFAETVGDLEALNCIYVLTWADIRAVGPDVWSPWKGALLDNLYQKTRKLLEAGDAVFEQGRKLADERRTYITEFCKENNLIDELSFYDNVSDRYYKIHDENLLKLHLSIMKQSSGQLFSQKIIHVEEQKVTQLILFIQNSQSVLSKVCGVLASCYMNILSLVQYVSSNGSALLLLRLTDDRNEMLKNERKWEDFEQKLTMVLSAAESVNELFDQAKNHSIFKKKMVRYFPPKVNLDNDISAYYTVIEIFSMDRIGLLFEIMLVLEEFGLYVDISKISTDVDQAADVFYVRDIFGKKITSKDKVKKLKQALQEVVKTPEQDKLSA